MPDMSGVSDMSDTSGVSGMSDMSGVSDVSDTSDVSGMSDMCGASDVSDVGDMCEVSDTSATSALWAAPTTWCGQFSDTCDMCAFVQLITELAIHT